MRNFYAVIIGSEILNNRRQDRHFDFVKSKLLEVNETLFSTFIIKDDANLIKKCFELIKSDKDSIMFCFGGIGSTPDDLTRKIAADVFRDSKMEFHESFKQDIINRFGSEAYPHRVNMAYLPVSSQLLHNPINNMSGFSIDNRFFFTPGFPQMAHPMIKSVIDKEFKNSLKKVRRTLLANTSENTLIEIMQRIPKDIELSSLPIFKDSKAQVELSLAGSDMDVVDRYFQEFIDELRLKKVDFVLM